MRYLVRAAINTLGLRLCTLLVPGISLYSLGNNRDIAPYLLTGGVVPDVVDCLVRPILVILSIPLYILTSGLFFLIVDAAMLRLATALTTGFNIGVTATTQVVAIMGGILLSLFNTFIGAMLPEGYRRRQAASACLLGVTFGLSWSHPVRPRPIATPGFSRSYSTIRGVAPFP